MSKITYHVIACIDDRLHLVGVTEDPDQTVAQVVAPSIAAHPHPTPPNRLHPILPFEAQTAPPPTPEEVPICQIHHLPMVWQKGSKGFFWSCHQRNLDDTWCSYKPPRLNEGPGIWPSGNGLGGPPSL